tara:strand:- start:754 stop:921 length:168 start_codon:yes stop_codon:yes gene_type:complete
VLAVIRDIVIIPDAVYEATGNLTTKPLVELTVATLADAPVDEDIYPLVVTLPDPI